MVHADPASDWPAVLTALNARFVIEGPGGSSRTAYPNEFFGTPSEPNLAANAHSEDLGTLLERSDRKSTRLNSSHLGISYAVFCLKKKKLLKNRTFSFEKTTQN